MVSCPVNNNSLYLVSLDLWLSKGCEQLSEDHSIAHKKFQLFSELHIDLDA